MSGNRLQAFFGDDIEETWDSIRSVPGAFGNIVIGVVRQVQPIDAAAFSLVIIGLIALFIGHVVLGERRLALYVISTLPLALWLVAGAIGGFVFHVGAIGRSSLAYWESYVLILLFAAFGVISLRLALDPRDRRVYRSPPSIRDA
jgi:hypothetical protein